MSPRGAWLACAVALLLAGGASMALPAAAAQESQSSTPDEEARAKLTKYLDLARTGRVADRPQAARRVSQLGAPAAERLCELAGEDGSGLVDLGPYLVEVLGDLGDTRLRAHLWSSLADPDFPWRGPAARSLAKTSSPEELGAFLALLDDHLWQVRRAALDGLAAHGSAEQSDAVRALLADQEGAVRRAAAALLDRWGERGALRYLVEELRREDQYFRLPLGAQARFDAAKLLAERLGADLELDPSQSPRDEQQARAISALEARLEERAGADWPELPQIARAAGELEPSVLGLELRSCRRGEFYLRWTEGDRLYVGTGNPAVVQLPAGSVARLRAALGERLAGLGETRYWGESGCDLEQYRLVDSGGSIESYLLSKGQADAGDLRPTALDGVAELLLATLPDEESPDPRLARLRSRARSALLVLGGAL